MARVREIETAGVVERYGALKAALPGAGRAWLDELRQAGLEAFAAAGLPGPKVEAWKYTGLNALKKLDLTALAPAEAVATDTAPTLLADAAGPRLIFVNGHYRPELSRSAALPEGVDVAALSQRFDDGQVAENLGRIADLASSPLAALNTALMQDGYVIRLAKEARIEAPIEILYLSLPGEHPSAAYPRNLIIAEAGSAATILEYHLGLGGTAYLANGVTEIRAGRGAELRHYKVQSEATEAFHIHQTTAELAHEARLESFVLMLGARLARNETRVALNGREAACRVNGAYLLAGRQHGDNMTAIDHAAADTTSRQVFKGVLDGNSRAVFHGKVLVRPGARGTDGQQLNKTLLLSDKAEIDSKPELEIHADDVKCSHGATAGELAEDAVFYLRSRGLPEAEARGLLVEAFLDEALAEVETAAVAETMRGLVQNWLRARRQGAVR